MSKQKGQQVNLLAFVYMVARGGLEPPTPAL